MSYPRYNIDPKAWEQGKIQVDGWIIENPKFFRDPNALETYKAIQKKLVEQKPYVEDFCLVHSSHYPRARGCGLCTAGATETPAKAPELSPREQRIVDAMERVQAKQQPVDDVPLYVQHVDHAKGILVVGVDPPEAKLIEPHQPPRPVKVEVGQVWRAWSANWKVESIEPDRRAAQTRLQRDAESDKGGWHPDSRGEMTLNDDGTTFCTNWQLVSGTPCQERVCAMCRRVASFAADDKIGNVCHACSAQHAPEPPSFCGCEVDSRSGAVSLRCPLHAEPANPELSPRERIVKLIDEAVAKCPAELNPQAYRAALIFCVEYGRHSGDLREAGIKAMTRCCLDGTQVQYNEALKKLAAKPPARKPWTGAWGRR